MKLRLRQRPALGLILLAGAALRLFRLGADSLWYDETVSAALAGSPLPELIRHTAGDIHPPGYYILLRGWLLLTGYPTGHADPGGMGLEFVAGFFSLFFGVLLIALVYALARRLAGPRVAIIAAALTALSPYNVWYSQEVRMYTLGAGLGVLVIYALWRATASCPSDFQGRAPAKWWAIYALAAAAGMYTLYYFAFLLIPLNLWALWRMIAGGRGREGAGEREGTSAGLRLPASSLHLLLADLAAAFVYAPWIPVAWRQATNPPVPPWRTAPNLPGALAESWTALSLGQSAPAWLWPALLLTGALYGLGLVMLRAQGAGKRTSASYLPVATFGPLALILLVSLATPLYHVRYLFTYSPAFYVVSAAGLAWLWDGARAARPAPPSRKAAKVAGIAIAAVWLAAAGVTLHASWFDPRYRADDHRAAVRFLRERWRPGDVALVNAGWAYTALTTYWDGPVAARSRLTADLPAPRADDALVVVTMGHIDGGPGLGWGDPRSDFFALPATVAEGRIAGLFGRFDRVWHYRIYDTVNDPGGRVRASLAADGQPFEDQVFPGEAFMRVQGFLPRAASAPPAGWPAATFEPGITVHAGPLPDRVAGGATLYPVLDWQLAGPSMGFATSVRLVAADGSTWAQGEDERPAGPGYPASAWPAGATVRQTASLPIPPGTPPGAYSVELVVYDPATGRPWPARGAAGDLAATANGVRLGEVAIARTIESAPPSPALARFGPLALLEAETPAITIAAGGQIPLALLWRAVQAPGEPLVVVVQLQDATGAMVAGLEEEPVGGRYPTLSWAAGELVRDRHTLTLPADLRPGSYRLIVGVYRAADRVRLETRAGLFGAQDHWTVKIVTVP